VTSWKSVKPGRQIGAKTTGRRDLAAFARDHTIDSFDTETG